MDAPTNPPAGSSPLQQRRQALAAGWATAWAARSPRERSLVIIAAAVLGLYLLWAVAVMPAWRTLRAAPAKLELAEGQLQQMQRLATEVQELRATPPLPQAQSQAALTASAARLGDKARLTLQGSRATLAISGLAGDELAAWLAEVRGGARARVIEATLNRTPQGLYAGSVVLAVGGGS